MDFIPVIGLMSGTSFDGIDTSILYTNGNKIKRTKFNKTFPYSKKTKLLIIEALKSPEIFCKNIDFMKKLTLLITLDHAKAVKKIIKVSKINLYLIGFHGQTIFHSPKDKISVQIGDGELLSKLTKIKVIYNFRNNDLKKGGQGAPIASIYHQQIIISKKLILPCAIINIGGISNITYWDGKKLLGFDVGPGNNLMDLQMSKMFNEEYDKFGEKASKGVADYNLINEYFNDEFYSKSPPKSLERSKLISDEVIQKVFKLDNYNCIATLCAITALAIKKSYQFFPEKVKTSIIVGGGQKNKHLISLIKNSNLSEYIFTGNEIELPADFIESELMAFLAVRRIRNLPSTFPSTTGVRNKTVLGQVSKIYA